VYLPQSSACPVSNCSTRRTLASFGDRDDEALVPRGFLGCFHLYSASVHARELCAAMKLREAFSNMRVCGRVTHKCDPHQLLMRLSPSTAL